VVERMDVMWGAGRRGAVVELHFDLRIVGVLLLVLEGIQYLVGLGMMVVNLVQLGIVS